VHRQIEKVHQVKMPQMTGALGAEISGVDLTGGVTAQPAFEIRQVFLNAWR